MPIERTFRLKNPVFITLLAIAPVSAYATNGYFASGYGNKSEGVAGVGIALPQDSIASAANPAGIVAVGNRFDLGADWFKPERSASITGNAFGADESYDGNGTSSFLIPSLGYSHLLTADLALGVAAYGNGGMNTDYKNNPFARFGATGSAGVNLEQLFVAPTAAYKIGDRNTLGLAINLAYQRFSAKGLDAFAPFSADPNHLTDQGSDTSHGAGIHLGWLGQVTDAVTLGLTWQSKTEMSKFDKYRGLFANQGEFDIPETYGAGIAVKATSAFTLAADVQRINYSKVAAVGDGLDVLLSGTPLGTTDGPGFGWRDVTVYKVGTLYQATPNWLVRAGFSHTKQPIPEDQTLFNILAPAVIENHITIGSTWTIDDRYELSLFYAYAYGDTVHGHGSIPPGFPPAGFGGGEANLDLKEHIFGLSLGYSL